MCLQMKSLNRTRYGRSTTAISPCARFPGRSRSEQHKLLETRLPKTVSTSRTVDYDSFTKVNMPARN